MRKLYKELLNKMRVIPDKYVREEAFSEITERIDRGEAVQSAFQNVFLKIHKVNLPDSIYYLAFATVNGLLDKQISFSSWNEMYNHLYQGHDLYNYMTGQYVFLYNNAGALAVYDIYPDEVIELAKKAGESGEYWGGLLGPGGSILDNEDYDRDTETKKYLKPSFDYCRNNFQKEGWVETDEIK